MRSASLVLSARNLKTSDVYFIASLGYAAFYNRTAGNSVEERSYCLFRITTIKHGDVHSVGIKRWLRLEECRGPGSGVRSNRRSRPRR